MGPKRPKRGELWSCLSNDGSESLTVCVIGRSRLERELAVVAPLVAADGASGLDVVAGDERAVAVWCFTWVEVARLSGPLGQLDCGEDIFAMYCFLVSPSARPGPTKFGLDQVAARTLIERMHPFVWRGHPEEWAL